MGRFGLVEIIIIFLIVVILFGAKRIPDIFKAIGSSIKNFKKGIQEDDEKEKQE